MLIDTCTLAGIAGYVTHAGRHLDEIPYNDSKRADSSFWLLYVRMGQDGS